MKRGRSSLWASLACFAVVAIAPPAYGQPKQPQEPTAAPLTEDQRKAQDHFQRARELYQGGSYREAVTELEVARGLDPKAKDLVMNLGIVHEKLGKFDVAVDYFKSYLEMDVTAAERTKVEGMIKRIEGAKREAPAQSPETTPTAPVAEAPGAPPPPPPPRGRVDELTIIAASTAVVGLAVGTGVGIYALTSRPSDFVTGRDGTYATLQQRSSDAHTAAIIADVSLGAGIIAGLVAGWLYFGRTKAPAARPTGSARVSAAPSSSGAFISVGGAF